MSEHLIKDLHAQLKELTINYTKAINFIRTIADDAYESYENLNEANWAAWELLREIGEVK